jgi:hypothetical protein
VSSCVAKRWGTQSLKEDSEVSRAHGVKASRPFRKQRPFGSNPNVAISLDCAPGRVLRMTSPLRMHPLSNGTILPRASSGPRCCQWGPLDVCFWVAAGASWLSIVICCVRGQLLKLYRSAIRSGWSDKCPHQESNLGCRGHTATS